MWDKAELGTACVVISAAFCYILLLSKDMTLPLPKLGLQWEENDSSYLPSIPTRLASPLWCVVTVPDF